jgi:ligand-binding SRPBCC domain-containing protein
MGIEYESVVDHPLAEVFAWHTRPGAMIRLVPPWQPMEVVAETQLLADGRAVLGLPGGLRWVAQHDPSGFDPPHRFVDVLSSEGPTIWPHTVRRAPPERGRWSWRSPERPVWPAPRWRRS